MRQVQRLVFLLIVFSCSTTSILAGDIPDWVPPDAVEAANTFWQETATSSMMTSDYGFRSNEEAMNCTLDNPVQLAKLYYDLYDPSKPPEMFYQLMNAYMFAVNSDSCLMATISIVKSEGEWHVLTIAFTNRMWCIDYFGLVHERYEGVNDIHIIGNGGGDKCVFQIFRDGIPETVLTWIPEEQRFDELSTREWLQKKRAEFDGQLKNPEFRERYERVRAIRKQQLEQGESRSTKEAR